MKTQFAGMAIAAMLTIASSHAAYAEDAATPRDTAKETVKETAKDIAAPSATTPDAPTSVPRPSIVPKSAETTTPAVAAEPAPGRHRRYTRHHYRRYAYWEPFPIYWPHIHRHHFYWSRISWFGL